jgi:hypothetical protein
MRELPVVPFCRSIRACHVGQITRTFSRIPARFKRGVGPIVTEREAGCGGRDDNARRALPVAYGEVVWSWPPDAEVKSAMMLRITPMTGARKPGPRGEYEISRKAIAQGMPDCLRFTCMLVCISFCA